MNSKLILGTVQFGQDYGINNKTGKISLANIRLILDYAFNNGIRFLDTAEAYGDAQIIIGEYHKKSKNKFEIITKFSSKIQGFPSEITQRIYHNLKVLNVNKLFSYMFHSYEEFDIYFKHFKQHLLSLKREGIITHLGVSLYTNDQIEKILKFDEITLIQIPYNLLDNENKRGDIIKKAKQRGIEIHARSIFLQGLFFKNPFELPEKIKSLTPYLKTLIGLCGEQNKICDVALGYVCNNDKIDKVLIGVDNIEHLKQNLVSEKLTLHKNLINEIRQVNVDEIHLLSPTNW